MEPDMRRARVNELIGEMSRRAEAEWGPEEAGALRPQIVETVEWISEVEGLQLDVWSDEPDFVGFPPRPAIGGDDAAE